jgi:hypothetical protein
MGKDALRSSVTLLVVALWVSGCGNSPPTSPGPEPSPDSFVVSGLLSETVDGVSRPLAGGQVRLFRITGGTGGGSTEVEEVFFADLNGRYTARVPSNSRVFAYVRDVRGPWQPCLASAFVQSDTTIDVQVVSGGSPITPPPAASPMIAGFVYETTPGGRVPLRGVTVWLEAGLNIYTVAITQTDDTGRFFFCRVNAPVWMGVSSRQEWFQSIPGTADVSFEIELRR